MSETALYVMQYPDGSWVQRDDSSGPMSTGGYPFPVKELSKATVWDSKEKALKYRATGRENFTLHRLTLATKEETITPIDEAEARGDEEFKEYQRLAKKFGIKGVGECPFVEAWVGKCKKAPEIGELYCDRHKDMKCYRCGAQATSNCAHAGQFVCGTPMCDIHTHH